MLLFLRRIRQRLLSKNKFTVYLTYAVGEIVLVVIGILIAIQVDNWNTARKQRDVLRSYASALINDLENDLDVIDVSYGQVRQRSLYIDSLSGYTFNRTIEDMSGVDLDILARAGYRPYAWNRSTLAELKSSGAMRYMRNDSLSKAIVAYEAFTYHLDSDLDGDEVLREQADAAKSRVVNNNYGSGELRNFSPEGWWERDSLEIPDYAASEDYQKFKAMNLPLLTNDINQVHVMVNQYLKLRNEYDSRVREMARAREMAENLISLLKEEYDTED